MDATQAEFPGSNTRVRVLALITCDQYPPGFKCCVDELKQCKEVQITMLPRVSEAQIRPAIAQYKPNYIYIYGGTSQEEVTREEGPEVKKQKRETIQDRTVLATVMGSLKFATEPATTPNVIPPGVDMTPDSIVAAFSDIDAPIECIFLDGQRTDLLGEALRTRVLGPDGAPRIRHVIAYPTAPKPSVPPAGHFARAFFASLRLPGVTPSEAYATALYSLYAHCQRYYNGSVVSGFIPPTTPVLLWDPPASAEDPAPSPPSAAAVPPPADGARLITTVPGWDLVKLLSPRTETRVTLIGDRRLSAPQRLACVAEVLRGLLAAVARVATVGQLTAGPRPTSGAFPADLSIMQADVRLAAWGPVSILLSGPPQIIQDPKLVEQIVRNGMAADASTLSFRVPPGTGQASVAAPGTIPPGSAAVVARRSAIVAGGSKIIEVQLDLPVWALQALKIACLDATVRELVSAAGLAAVGGHPVTSWESDGSDMRHYRDVLAYCNAAVLDVQHINLFSYPPKTQLTSTTVAATEALGHTLTGRRAAAAAAQALAEEPHPPASAVILAVAQPQPMPTVDGRPYWEAAGLPRRRPLRDCTEEEFLKDLCAFWNAKFPHEKGKVYEPSTWPNATLSGMRLDAWPLYREVASRGGYKMGNGINWKGQVFTQMKNSAGKPNTAVSHQLKGHYRKFLLAYEECHPEDTAGDRCAICGGGEEAGQEWLCCGRCSGWQHYGCDRRAGLAPFREFNKENGKEFVCSACEAAGVPGGEEEEEEDGAAEENEGGGEEAGEEEN